MTVMKATKTVSTAFDQLAWATSVKHDSATRTLMANDRYCIQAGTVKRGDSRWRRVRSVGMHRGTCDQATASLTEKPERDIAMRTVPDIKVHPMTPITISSCRKPLTLKPYACARSQVTA